MVVVAGVVVVGVGGVEIVANGRVVVDGVSSPCDGG